MPRTAQTRRRKLTKKEKHFVNLFIKLGADESQLEDCAKKAGLTPTAARKLVKTKQVQNDIDEWKEVVRLEQQRQKLLGPAVAQVTETLAQKAEEATARAVVAETELNEIKAIPKKKINRDDLEHYLMWCVIQERDLAIKLDAIKAGFVVEGSVEHRGFKILKPPDPPAESQSGGVYMSLFNREAIQAPPQEQPDPDVHDLYPGKPVPPTPETAPLTLPVAGESIDEVPTPKGNPNVITVTLE
jgi:hypothetical protein